MKIETDNRKAMPFGGYNEYSIISNCEMTERGHKDDHRFGVCIAVTEDMCFSTHEYDAEQNDRFYWGHYFLHDESSAWQDYFDRCQTVVDYVRKWENM